MKQINLLRQIDLARRWSLAPNTLAKWRCEGKGPQFIKIGRRILYNLEDIEAYENFSMETAGKKGLNYKLITINKGEEYDK